ncbi:Cysteine--tRNA ligase, mitochondrial [Dermatophagoides farinae]|uniref:Cysteine--tRNA ligase, mitochondrial n=1 Tax=Dermatophagoides farinae TaxID=6954 RepID=A0A922HL59_DERFA|nr:Cysteine--tRNA ligase, mitochondrial [Dermatophagoides farinae]
MWIPRSWSRLIQRIVAVRASSITRQYQHQLSNTGGIIEFDQLQLRSTFNKQNRIIPNVAYLNRSDRHDANLNLYCCGPTVYDHSHLGHAIAYIRCDLIIRMLQTYCNVNVYFAMNITDIDDKIIRKSQEIGVDYRQLSNEYYQSFVEDMNSLRVTTPDYVGKVLDNIDTISDYIERIYDKGFAYISPETGDINFDYEKFLQKYSIENIPNFGGSQVTIKSIGKRSPKDFALWKSSKPNEPKWSLKLATGQQQQVIAGRPGWHVECSAISHSIFGDKIDLHFGGSDLVFPHHHCESCCSHAYLYQSEINSTGHHHNHRELYSNVNVWLHSGHLILRSEKMSKSLGNVILIKDFLQKYSANILRLLCIRTHYRAEIDFDEKLLLEMTAFDEKLREFIRHIEWAIYKLSSTIINDSNSDLISPMTAVVNDHSSIDNDDDRLSLGQWIDQIEQEIWSGILDDMDMNRPLVRIIRLASLFPNTLPVWLDSSYNNNDDGCNRQQQLLFECIRLRQLLRRWFSATSLDYGLDLSSSSSSMANVILPDQIAIVEYLTEFRRNIRQSTLVMLKNLKKIQQQQQQKQKSDINNNNGHGHSEQSNTNHHFDQQKNEMIKILEHCDQTRTFLERRGFKLKDQRSSSS